MSKLRYGLIGIDFDGTIVHDSFPVFTGFKDHAIRVLDRIHNSGGKIIIWTCRTGDYAEFAKYLLEINQIKYDAFNDNLDENIHEYGANSRKIHADVYIDDKSIENKVKGIDWLEIEKLLFDEGE